MCANLRWLLCAIHGKLPSQRDRDMHFADPPGELDFSVYDDPTKSLSYWPEPHAQTFAASDVLFAEVAVLTQVCDNTDTLFSVARGEAWRCEFSDERYRALADALIASEKERVRGGG